MQFIYLCIITTSWRYINSTIAGWKPIVLTFGPKNQPFRNKSGKTQPIRTKFGIRGHVKGWKRSGNFGRDRPISGEMGVARFSYFGLFSLYKTPKTYLSVTSLQSRGYIAEWLRFLPIDAMHKRGLCRHAVLSVCVSVTFVSCVKANKDIFELFSPSGSQAILVFPCQTGWRYSDGNPHNGGVECRWGRQKTRWTNIWLRCIQVYSVINRTSREVWK